MKKRSRELQVNSDFSLQLFSCKKGCSTGVRTAVRVQHYEPCGVEWEEDWRRWSISELERERERSNNRSSTNMYISVLVFCASLSLPLLACMLVFLTISKLLFNGENSRLCTVLYTVMYLPVFLSFLFSFLSFKSDLTVRESTNGGGGLYLAF